MTDPTQSAALGALLLVLLSPAGMTAQSEEDLAQQLAELARGQQKIRRQIAEIKDLLEARAGARPAAPAGPNVKDRVFDLGANPVKGERTAPLTLVEFTDYQ